MKKMILMLLCVMVLFAALPSSAEYPGDEVLVTFTVKANEGHAITMTAKLEYDHDALEIIPEKNRGKDDIVNAFGFTDVTDFPLEVRFRIRSYAVPGDYPITLLVQKATNYDLEDVTAGLAFFEETISVVHPDEKADLPTPAPEIESGPLKTGDTFLFGTYPQTSSGDDSTPIEWIVLDTQGNKALLISRYGLECMQYNDTYTNVAWETCALRKWLNKDFISKAFSAKEQEVILPVTVNTASPIGSSGGNSSDTLDKVFLLSCEEADDLFESNAARMCVLTDWALAAGADIRDNTKLNGRSTGNWWLRSPLNADGTPVYATIVTSSGTNSDVMHEVDYAHNVVRPALWIDMESIDDLSSNATAEPAPTKKTTTNNSHTHSWKAATCTKPKTCSTCGATDGSALGHKWDAATCTKPKTCSRCGATDGSALGHKWDAATCTKPKTCSRCGVTDGTAPGHNWQAATCTKPKTCTRCGKTEGKALGHDWIPATKTKPKTCSRCGATSGK